MKAQFRDIIARIFERQVRRLIARNRLKVVAVAGSVGKTSTKAAITSVLAQKYRVLVYTGGYNTEIGLPLSIFGMEVPGLIINPFAWIWRILKSEWLLYHYPYEMVVLELGTDRPGEMGRFLTYLTPDLGVITAVAPEHMANFPGGLDQVAEEELALAARCTRVLASRDEITETHRRRYLDHLPHVTYYGASVRKGFRYHVASASLTRGAQLDVYKDGDVAGVDIPLRLYGAPAYKAAVAAFAAGDYFRVSKHQIEAGLATLRPVAGRLNPLPGLGGSTLIDDTYNAQPDAVLAALRELMTVPATTRRIAVLGSMSELGDTSRHYHEQVGATAAGVDLLITVGADATRWLGPAALEAGLDPSRFKPADSPYAAGQFLQPMLAQGDVVLLKGSQNGVFLEEATKLLLADPADAARLVRQSPAWLRTKHRAFRHS